MMHGHEKSDSVIVAVKPANKTKQRSAEQCAKVPTAAESLSQGRGPKEMLALASKATCRVQNRGNVTKALERIRKVAKEWKKERFTALFHHISIDLLRKTFFELRRRRAGVDRLT
jgi:RNA-directed DNA polymerase